MTSIKDKIDENRAHSAPERGGRSPAGSDYGDEPKPRTDEADIAPEDDGDEGGTLNPKREPGAHA